MTVLRPALAIAPEETLLSYTDRLSMLHTGRDMRRLLKDRGINVEHFTSGRFDAIQALAEAIGREATELHHISIRVTQRGGEFRGEDISKPFLSPRAQRYCPECLAEDGARINWRFRLIWGFRHVQRCDLHNCWLTLAPQKNATSMRLALNGAELEAPSNVSEVTPEFHSWLRERVHGDALQEPPWLASQTLEQVLAASEMIGGVLEYGHKFALKRLNPEQKEAATDIGFSIFREGPETVTQALDTIRQTSPATAVQAGPLAHYGKLFDWLDRRCNAIDPGPIRDMLRDHIVKHSAVEPGTTVLGEEIHERRFHTLLSLSESTGIERKRLARLLKKLNKIPQHASEVEAGNMIFAAEETSAIVDAFQSALPMQDVPDHLGATKHQFEALYRSGIVQPLVPCCDRGSVRNVLFDRSKLDGLLERVAKLPKLDAAGQGTFHTVSYAAQRGAGHFERIFRDILEKRVPAYLHPEKRGIGAVYVNVASLLEGAEVR